MSRVSYGNPLERAETKMSRASVNTKESKKKFGIKSLATKIIEDSASKDEADSFSDY